MTAQGIEKGGFDWLHYYEIIVSVKPFKNALKKGIIRETDKYSDGKKGGDSALTGRRGVRSFFLTLVVEKAEV